MLFKENMKVQCQLSEMKDEILKYLDQKFSEKTFSILSVIYPNSFIDEHFQKIFLKIFKIF